MQQREQPVCQFLYGNYEEPSHQLMNNWRSEHSLPHVPRLSVRCESGRSRGPGVKPQHRQRICTHQCIFINTLFVASPPQLSAAVMTCALQQKRDVRLQDNGRKWTAWTTSAGICLCKRTVVHYESGSVRSPRFYLSSLSTAAAAHLPTHPTLLLALFYSLLGIFWSDATDVWPLFPNQLNLWLSLSPAAVCGFQRERFHAAASPPHHIISLWSHNSLYPFHVLFKKKII